MRHGQTAPPRNVKSAADRCRLSPPLPYRLLSKARIYDSCGAVRCDATLSELALGDFPQAYLRILVPRLSGERNPLLRHRIVRWRDVNATGNHGVADDSLPGVDQPRKGRR